MPDQDDEKPEYVTVMEAARTLGFSVRTLVRWMDEGRLPSVVISGESLLSRKDLEAILTRPAKDDPSGTEPGRS